MALSPVWSRGPQAPNPADLTPAFVFTGHGLWLIWVLFVGPGGVLSRPQVPLVMSPPTSMGVSFIHSLPCGPLSSTRALPSQAHGCLPPPHAPCLLHTVGGSHCRAAGDTSPIPRVQPSEQPCNRAVGQHELTGSEEKDMAPGPPTSAGPGPASLWLPLKTIH